MLKHYLLYLVVIGLPLAGWAAEGRLESGGVNPGYHAPPAWFKQSFLDLGEDVAEAAAADKRLLLYFYQDGCPYCAKLLNDNFGQHTIAEKTRALFDVVAVNMWGDREVSDRDGEVLSEKAYAAKMRVMFTPTLLFLDEGGEPVLRLNGYYHPHKFERALDFAAGKGGAEEEFAALLDATAAVPASGVLHDEPFFMAAPFSLDRSRFPGQRPLLVLFEQRVCAACDELHMDVLSRERTRALLQGFDVVQLDRQAATPVLTPAGKRRSAAQWARELGIRYAPTLLFFDEGGREVFRAEAYLKAFHVQSVLDYVGSGAYRDQPSFQRFVQGRAERLEAAGEHVDLWD